MAGTNDSARGSFPNFKASSAHADGMPGTVTGAQPYLGMPVHPAALSFSIEMPSGARPLAFRPYSLPRIQTRANASPPMPLDVGSTTVRQAAAAMAASTAFPPCLSIARPACAASGCDAATMPFLA